MGYWIALVIGVLIILMAIGGVLFMAMGIGLDGGPRDGAVDHRGPFGAIIPFAIGAVLIAIAIIGLRRRNSRQSAAQRELDNLDS